MAHYAIGDIQGCYSELCALLDQIGFNHGSDTLWLVGDIVNRGPQSLESLQFAMRHSSSVQIVLGNHDLHLLALCYGYGKLKKHDTLAPILNHPECAKMRDWLRQQPLMVHDGRYVLVHAGLLPEWNVDQAAQYAREVEAALQSPQPQHYFAEMYGNYPEKWQPDLQGIDRLRFITNIFTRMRVLALDDTPDFAFKSVYADIPPDRRAWFDSPMRRHLSHKIVFGHWSALGYLNDKQVIALDTGALWGGALTAIDLDSGQISQKHCTNYKDWQSL